MKFITKRLIELTAEESQILMKADDIICQIKTKMNNDSMSNNGQKITLHMYSMYDEECKASYTDIRILDRQLFILANASEIITSFDEGDEDGQ